MDKSNQNLPSSRMREIPPYSDPYQYQLQRAPQGTALPPGYPQQYFGHPYGLAYSSFPNEPVTMSKEVSRSEGQPDSKKQPRPDPQNPPDDHQPMKQPETDRLAHSEYSMPPRFYPSAPTDLSSIYPGYPSYSYPMPSYYSYSSPAYPYYYPMPGFDPYAGYSSYPTAQTPMGGYGYYQPFGYDPPAHPTPNAYPNDQPTINPWPSKSKDQNQAPISAPPKEVVIPKKEPQQPIAAPIKETKIAVAEPSKLHSMIRSESQAEMKKENVEQDKNKYKMQSEIKPPIETNQIRVIPPLDHMSEEEKEEKKESDEKEESDESEVSDHEESDVAISKLQRPSIMSEKMPDPIPNSVVLTIRPPSLFQQNVTQGQMADIISYSNGDLIDLRKRSDLSSASAFSNPEKTIQMLKVQSKKVKTFWRGVNFTFPDTFKRYYEGRIIPEDYSYVTEVMDLSSKSLAANQYLQQVDIKAEK